MTHLFGFAVWDGEQQALPVPLLASYQGMTLVVL
jgi:hypothetical protein